MSKRVRARRALAVVACGSAVAVLCVPAASIGASPKHGAKIVEQTTAGYLMTVKVARSGHSVLFSLKCPNGTSLGSDTASVHRNNHFSAEHGQGSSATFRFSGRFDSSTHFRGSGTVNSTACGTGVSHKLFEPKPGEARMTQCPTNGTDNPLPANTPAQFAGIVPGAALGTRVRIEYTDPNQTTVVVHLTTDAAGRFTDVHAFPPSGDGEFAYGADAIPRYPDAGLSPGHGCDFTIK